MLLFNEELALRAPLLRDSVRYWHWRDSFLAYWAAQSDVVSLELQGRIIDSITPDTAERLRVYAHDAVLLALGDSMLDRVGHIRLISTGHAMLQELDACLGRPLDQQACAELNILQRCNLAPCVLSPPPPPRRPRTAFMLTLAQGTSPLRISVPV